RIWRDTACRNGLRSRAMCSPTSSRIIGEDSELLSWQSEAAQNIKLRGANNCGTHVLGKNIYLMSTVFFSFNNFTSMKRYDLCEYFELKTKRINSKDIFFYSLFCSYSLGVPIIVEGTVCRLQLVLKCISITIAV